MELAFFFFTSGYHRLNQFDHVHLLPVPLHFKHFPSYVNSCHVWPSSIQDNWPLWHQTGCFSRRLSIDRNDKSCIVFSWSGIFFSQPVLVFFFFFWLCLVKITYFSRLPSHSSVWLFSCTTARKLPLSHPITSHTQIYVNTHICIRYV